ncbi:hypothetical protein GCM10028807_50760 [Spirosoma daeguense]
MKTATLTILFCTILTTFANAQMKVANFSYGEPGTDKYEQLSFWAKNGQRAEIRYTYGKDRKETTLTYLGKSPKAKGSGFNVQFPNNYVLYVAPVGNKLRLVDAQATYQKTFAWEYEGPVNGIGTFCNVCAQDDKEAMQLVRTYYLR